MSPADVVIAYLVARGVAYNPPVSQPDNWPIGNGAIPPGGENYIGVINYGNLYQGRLLKTGKRIAPGLVQIMVRAVDEPTGWTKGEEIQSEFDKIGVSTEYGGVGGMIRVAMDDGTTVILQAIHVRIPITPLGQEPESSRYLYSINVQVALADFN